MGVDFSGVFGGGDLFPLYCSLKGLSTLLDPRLIPASLRRLRIS